MKTQSDRITIPYNAHRQKATYISFDSYGKLKFTKGVTVLPEAYDHRVS